MKEFDVTIVGAGIAGLSAAIYLKRSSLTSVVLDKGAPGGKLLNIHEIDNYPGLGPVSGPELAMKSMDHATKLGVIYEYGNVLGITKDGDDYIVSTDMDQYRSKAVIIATGTQTKVLGVPGEKEHTGRGVSYCATCDGAFFKGKRVAVVGGGNTAAMDALFLSGLCEKVYVIHRRNVLRADKLLQDRLFETENIELLWSSRVDEILGADEGVRGIRVGNLKDGSEKEIQIDGVFAAVGIVPMSEPFSDVLKADEDGYIIADESCVTNIDGVFAAGDIRSKALRQVVTAVSDGANAVTSATRYLSML